MEDKYYIKMDKRKQGKKNRAAGGRFELKVRKDLESKGWIVSKWMNNVELIETDKYSINGKIETLPKDTCFEEIKESFELHDTKEEFKLKYILDGQIIPAKHKFRGPGIPMAIGTGFPDFVAFTLQPKIHTVELINYQVIGVEVKSNGYLDKIERAKCEWLLKNNIFSKILTAQKGKKRGGIEYNEFK